MRGGHGGMADVGRCVVENVLSKNSSASSECVSVNLVPRLSLLSHNNNIPHYNLIIPDTYSIALS